MATTFNFDPHIKGDRLVQSFTIVDDEGDPVDLTTCETIQALFQLQKLGNTSPNLVLDLNEGLSISGGSDNVLTLSSRFDIEQGIYDWELKLMFPAETNWDPRTALKGTISIIKGL